MRITGGVITASTKGNTAYDIGSGSGSSDGGSLEVAGGTLELAKNGTNVVSPSFKSCTIKGNGAGKYSGIYDANGNIINQAVISAKPTTSTVYINGKSYSFEAYNINDNNYFKLRDLAKVLSGTETQFEVTWDNNKRAINLIRGKPYTSVGGEMATGDGTAKSAQANTAAIYLDGSSIALAAYNINGKNNFKLRDVGKTFDFDVTWDGKNNAIVVETAKNYTDG